MVTKVYYRIKLDKYSIFNIDSGENDIGFYLIWAKQIAPTRPQKLR